jgi:mevalonate pyrophosphate decarboxylase
MNSYFSTISLENGRFVGTVYNSSTNQEVYKTQPHPSQILANRDVNNFIKTAQVNTPSTNAITSPSTPPTTVTPRRCCGR